MSDTNEMKIREVGEAIPKPSDQARRIAMALLYFQYHVQFESSVSSDEKEQIIQDTERVKAIFARHASRSRSYAWYKAVSTLIDDIYIPPHDTIFRDLFPDGVRTEKVGKYQAANINHLREALASDDVQTLRETLIGILFHYSIACDRDKRLSEGAIEYLERIAELEKRIQALQEKFCSPDKTLHRRFCLTCKYEPEWKNNHGRCKLSISDFSNVSAVMMRRFSDPDDVITVEGDRVMNCTGWEAKVTPMEK